MPSDAKFGLVVGVSLVIAVAVVFFRKETPARPVSVGEPPTAVDRDRVRIPQSDDGPTSSRTRNDDENTPARLAVNRRPGDGSQVHLIQPGDTLFSIARRHYGDGERFIDLYRINRALIPDPDHLPIGTSIVIP